MKKKQDFSLHYAFAGSLSGIVQKTLVQPLDLVKTRMQVQDASTVGRYTGLRHAFRAIVQREGVRALYTGLAPNLLGSGVSWGVYFQVYHTAKRALRTHLDRAELSAPMNFACASAAGVSTALVANPIWMVKTRLQLQQKHLTPVPAAGGAAIAISAPTAATATPIAESTATAMRPYTGTVDAFTRIVREEGVLALYRGLGPALSLVSNGALQFMFYEELKSGWKRYVLNAAPSEQHSSTSDRASAAQAAALAARTTAVPRSAALPSSSIGGGVDGGDSVLATADAIDNEPRESEASLNSMHFLAMGAFAKLMSTSITYPLQVLRARMFRRDLPSSSSMVDVARSVYRSLGARGFYQGFVPYATKTCISSALTFGAFENLLKLVEYVSHGSKK